MTTALPACSTVTASALDDPRATWGFSQVPTEPPVPTTIPVARVLQREEWIQEGLRLFGPNKRDWAFRCPLCGQVQSVRDFLRHGLDPQGKVFNTCLGGLLSPSLLPPRRRCDLAFERLEGLALVFVIYKGKNIPVFPFANPVQVCFKVR